MFLRDLMLDCDFQTKVYSFIFKFKKMFVY